MKLWWQVRSLLHLMNQNFRAISYSLLPAAASNRCLDTHVTSYSSLILLLMVLHDFWVLMIIFTRYFFSTILMVWFPIALTTYSYSGLCRVSYLMLVFHLKRVLCLIHLCAVYCLTSYPVMAMRCMESLTALRMPKMEDSASCRSSVPSQPLLYLSSSCRQKHMHVYHTIDTIETN